MSKLKKIFFLCAVYALIASLAIGATLAYMTDRDGAANVFTVGDVDITLSENFEQGAALIPGIKVEKEVYVENVGANDAWVWITVSVPAALDDAEGESGTTNVLHWNVPGAVWNGYHTNEKYASAETIARLLNDGWITEAHLSENGMVKDSCTWIICQEDDSPVPIGTRVIDGVTYNVYTFLYNGVLRAGETTPVSLHQVYLDAHVDIDEFDNWYWVEGDEMTRLNWNSETDGNPLVYVNAYAIQQESFASVKEAYDAYLAQWGDNVAGFTETTAAP